MDPKESSCRSKVFHRCSTSGKGLAAIGLRESLSSMEIIPYIRCRQTLFPMKKTLLPLFVLLTFSMSLFAQDCAPGWAHYRTVTVDNSAGEDLTDYQVAFTLNTAELVAAEKLQADGADLRVFTSDCTDLPFWGDSLGTSTTTQIFVNVPTLMAGSTLDLQVYYGNATAETATDGNQTFLFFDDFRGTEVDANKWETVGEFDRFEVSEGKLQYASTRGESDSRFKFAKSKASFAEKVIFDFVVERSSADGFGFSSTDNLLDRFIFRDAGFGFDTLNQIAVIRDTLNNGFASQNTYPLLRFARSEFNTVSITPQINDENEFVMTRFANEGLGDENLDTLTLTSLRMSGFHFIVSSFSPGFVIELDNIRVRQHTDTPPGSTVGAEMVADPSSIRSLIDPTLVRVYPNPTSDFMMVEVDLQTDVRVQLLDANGRLVSGVGALLPNALPRSIDISAVPAGVYVLQLLRAEDGALLHGRQLMIAR